MKMVSTMAFILLAFCGGPSATTPPHSPDYCGPFLCIEISPSFDVDAIKTTSFPALDSAQTELEAIGRMGKATVVAKPVSGREECKATKPLVLMRTDEGIKGEGFIEGPNHGACLHVTLSFTVPNEDRNSPISPPITAMWAVDEVPSTFWKKGYALRLGPQMDVLF